MQQAIPYKSRQLFNSPSRSSATASEELVSGKNVIREMVSENAVIVFARTGCCMGHVVRLLLLGLGVNPCVCEVDDEAAVSEIIVKSSNHNHNQEEEEEEDRTVVQFPAVFIGGKLFGGLDRIMATHISGELIPVLKEAKALWL